MQKHRYGLLGKDIDYSFSRNYFKNKFQAERITNATYENFDFQSLGDDFERFLTKSELAGMNVTIPYKEEVIPFLDELDQDAQEIGAVNTIRFKEGAMKGFNTDAYGFDMAVSPLLKPEMKSALILGTGGASKAVAYVLNKRGIQVTFASRNPDSPNQISYDELLDQGFGPIKIIVNASPIGTFPQVFEKPKLPYDLIKEDFVLFDLIYNPEVTAFLQEGKSRGAQIKNGYEMLVHQAEKAWEIWNK
ncbi:MAG: shikimate dehydrogenase family protein [Flavobacteriaceae bacterium]